MRRPLCFFLTVLLVGVAGCGKDEAPSEQASQGTTPAVSSQLPPADVTSKPGEAMIDASEQQFPVEGLYLNPYFDEAGTQTELAVKPGEMFRLHVFAETAEPYHTNAIQLRIGLPEGVDIMGASEFEHKSVSAGDPEQNYMLAYDCQPAGRFRLVTYICSALPEFKGGEIRVIDGMPASGIAFMGFVSCEYVEMRASGGTATLTLK